MALEDAITELRDVVTTGIHFVDRGANKVPFLQLEKRMKTKRVKLEKGALEDLVQDRLLQVATAAANLSTELGTADHERKAELLGVIDENLWRLWCDAFAIAKGATTELEKRDLTAAELTELAGWLEGQEPDDDAELAALVPELIGFLRGRVAAMADEDPPEEEVEKDDDAQPEEDADPEEDVEKNDDDDDDDEKAELAKRDQEIAELKKRLAVIEDEKRLAEHTELAKGLKRLGEVSEVASITKRLEEQLDADTFTDVVELLKSAESKVAALASVAGDEIGGNGDDVSGSAKDEVERLAKQLKSEESDTYSSLPIARAEIRKRHPELAARERAEKE